MSKPACFNHPPPVTAYPVHDGYERHTVWTQDGWKNIHVPKFVMQKNPFDFDCRQWVDGGLARIQSWDCEGCKWLPEYVDVVGGKCVAVDK
jgi:hypothetical protein